ncbi:MAG: hypothetical protein L6Q98_01035 [Anaerolineae bacterium]|nr:hypothetical protein [Anaerolineae bacterium]NUQ03938.1 hypothetical protein [Anaerolineae bacterium]
MPSQLVPSTLSADGAICHWLSAGVYTTPLRHLAAHVRESGSPFGERGRWAMNFWAFDPDVADLKLRAYRGLPASEVQSQLLDIAEPVLGGPAPGGGVWRCAATEEDGVIDFSRFNFNPTLMEGWLCALIDSPADAALWANLLTIGPARLWLNGQCVEDFAEHFSYVALQRVPVRLTLRAGLNTLLLHGAMLGWREARLALGLRLLNDPESGGLPEGLSVRLPVGAYDADVWEMTAAQMELVQVRAFAFPTLPGRLWCDPAAEAPITVDVEVGIPLPDTPWAKLIGLTLPRGRARLTLEPGKPADLPITPELAEAFAHLPGENALSLVVRPINGIPLEVRREIWASANAYSRAPYGTYDERIAEARRHLASMPYDVPASMAAVATGAAAQIDSNAVAVACAFLNDRADCADFYAVGLLAALEWYGGSPALKQEDQAKIEDALRRFKYWIDEPGIDAMCYFTENHQILFHVTQYLAGQRYPEWTFDNSGLTGREQQALAAPRIDAWIRRRLRGMFSEWDSNAYLTLDAFAMLALVEFARDEALVRLAGLLLDKVFFSLAAQTYRGTLGSSHGRCYTVALKSARVENTSPLCRIAFGMGVFNGETRATGLLALSRRYRVPEIIQRIGADVDAVVTTRARAYGALTSESDMKSGVWDVRTITYRTPDGMLSAALDHRPGAMGIQEHLWQATLSPEAAVFTTYPGNAQEHGNARPNFWAGSARLPRVGMSARDLICLYRLEPGIGMGFTHAYFPTEAFDEWRIEVRWAFARVGDGYAALWGDGDLLLTASGRHAHQELRSSGAGQVWLCRLGRRADDGDFAQFCASLAATAPQVDADGIGVRWTTPDERRLAFAWDGVFTVNAVVEDWGDFPHYANGYTDTPHGAESMILRFRGESLTLDYGG